MNGLRRDLSGEEVLPARWTRCVVCGAATSQPPVCWDLRCEDTLNRRHDEQDSVS